MDGPRGFEAAAPIAPYVTPRNDFGGVTAATEGYRKRTQEIKEEDREDERAQYEEFTREISKAKLLSEKERDDILNPVRDAHAKLVALATNTVLGPKRKEYLDELELEQVEAAQAFGEEDPLELGTYELRAKDGTIVYANLNDPDPFKAMAFRKDKKDFTRKDIVAAKAAESVYKRKEVFKTEENIREAKAKKDLEAVPVSRKAELESTEKAKKEAGDRSADLSRRLKDLRFDLKDATGADEEKIKQRIEATQTELDSADKKYSDYDKRLNSLTAMSDDAYVKNRQKMQAEADADVAKRAKEYGNRSDGTPKGPGFLGEITIEKGENKGKVATELSIGVNIDGKEVEIPALVPGLSEKEIQYLKSGGDPRKDARIVKKAVEHARKRTAAGKSPFLDEKEAQGGVFEDGQGRPIINVPFIKNQSEQTKKADSLLESFKKQKQNAKP